MEEEGRETRKSLSAACLPSRRAGWRSLSLLLPPRRGVYVSRCFFDICVVSSLSMCLVLGTCRSREAWRRVERGGGRSSPLPSLVSVRRVGDLRELVCGLFQIELFFRVVFSERKKSSCRNSVQLPQRDEETKRRQRYRQKYVPLQPCLWTSRREGEQDCCLR